MGWESRKGTAQRYYTRTRREGGRAVRQYLGAGPLAEAMAQLDTAERAERLEALERRRAERRRLEAAEQQLDTLVHQAEGLTRAVLGAAGYHRPKRGPWRKQRGKAMGTAPEQVQKQQQALELLKRAAEGDKQALKNAAQAFEAYPEAFEVLSLTRTVESELMSTTKWDSFAEVTVKAELSHVKKQLAGPNPSALERVLAERAALAWLQAHLAQVRYARFVSEGGTFAAGEFYHRQVERAERRLCTAVRSLAQVRKLQAPSATVILANMRREGLAEVPAPARTAREHLEAQRPAALPRAEAAG